MPTALRTASPATPPAADAPAARPAPSGAVPSGAAPSGAVPPLATPSGAAPAGAVPPVTAAAPDLRRLPTPRWDPPYDDEVGEAGGPVRDGAVEAGDRGRGVPGEAAVQGTLALAFLLPSGLPATPEPPALRLVPAGAPAEGPAAATAAVAAPLPEPRSWAGRFVQALVEVLAGDRPVGQLVRWTDAEVFADVHRRVTVAARACPPGRSGQRRAVLRSVHVSSPTEGVAEVCALVQRGPRATVMALRLDGRGDRWLCTALELG